MYGRAIEIWKLNFKKSGIFHLAYTHVHWSFLLPSVIYTNDRSVDNYARKPGRQKNKSSAESFFEWYNIMCVCVCEFLFLFQFSLAKRSCLKSRTRQRPLQCDGRIRLHAWNECVKLVGPCFPLLHPHNALLPGDINCT